MKFVKWAGVALLTLVVLAVGSAYGLTELRFRKSYESPEVNLPLRTDEATLARGRLLATTRGCVECHGANLAGTQFLDVPILARLYATNLTSGPGGIGSTYSPADWERAIRHGIRPDGKPLLFMPSQEFYPLSDDDLTALISFLVSVPPVEAQKTETSVGPLGRVLVATGQIGAFVPAELIDHDSARPVAPTPGITVAYGGYLATGCMGCHGENYSGGPIPGAPPEFIPTANITPHETGIGHYEENDFFRLIREGRRPDGTAVNDQMPWRGLSLLSDDEVSAIWLFLQSLPPREYGNR